MRMQVFIVSGNGVFPVKGPKLCYRLSCRTISPPFCETEGPPTFSRSLVVPYLGFPSLFHNLSRCDPASVMPYIYVRELANAVESSTRLVVQKAPRTGVDEAVLCHLTCSQRSKPEGQVGEGRYRYRFDLLLRTRRSQTGRGFMVVVRRRHLEGARHNSTATDYSTKSRSRVAGVGKI